jgi:hypothetical protein
VEAFEAAKEEACEQLEREALRRAVSGVEEPVYHNGKVVGNIRKYSEVLLIFLMKGAMPGRYRDNATVEHTGRGGQPLAVEVKFVRPLLSVMPGRSDTAEEVA